MKNIKPVQVIGFIGVLLASSMLALPATAQDQAPTPESSVGRFAIGDNFLVPHLRTELVMDDNIYKSQSGEEDDMIWTVKPKLTLASDWDQHGYEVYGGADLGYYWDQDDNDYTDYEFGGKVFRDLSDVFRLGGNFNYEMGHSSRGQDLVNQNNDLREPVDVDTVTAGLDTRYIVGASEFAFAHEVQDVNWDDGVLLSGVTEDRDFRDAVYNTTTFRPSYKINESMELFGIGRWNMRNYDDTTSRLPDNDGYEALAGVNYAPSDKIDLSVAAGQMDQSYDLINKDVQMMDYEMKAKVKPIDKVTLTFVADRELEDSTEVSTSGAVKDDYSLSSKYAFTDNIALKGSLSYKNIEYQDSATSTSGGVQEDDIYGLTMGAGYDITEWAEVGVTYGYSERDSNAASNNYERNTLTAGLKTNF